MNKKQSRNIKAASFSVLALSFCALMVFLTKQQPLETDQTRAISRADIYAANLIKTKFIIKTPDTKRMGRGLASVEFQQEVLEGPVGIDPWGYPFNFIVKKNPTNPQEGVLIVWSAGSDNKLETSRDMIAEDHSAFNGDDFGKTYNFSL